MATTEPMMILIFLRSPAMAAVDPTYSYCFGGNYTSNSTYKANLDTLLSSISSSSADDHGFYNLKVGAAPNVVYGTALCRGDVNATDCLTCREYTATKVAKDCSTQKDAVAFHDVCVLRFSDESILGVLETTPYHCRKGRAPVGDPEALFEAIFNLSRSLINRTAAGDSQHKFALGDFRFNDSFGTTQTVYELMQCTPDISESDCYHCLEVAVGRIRSCIGGLTGGRVLQPSFNLRYEQYIFWDSSYDAVPAPAPAILPSLGSNITAGGKENATTRSLIIAIIVPGASLFMLGMIMLCLSRKSSKKLIVLKNGLKLCLGPLIHESKAETLRAESLPFDFHVVQAAINLVKEGLLWFTRALYLMGER